MKTTLHPFLGVVALLFFLAPVTLDSKATFIMCYTCLNDFNFAANRCISQRDSGLAFAESQAAIQIILCGLNGDSGINSPIQSPAMAMCLSRVAADLTIRQRGVDQIFDGCMSPIEFKYNQCMGDCTTRGGGGYNPNPIYPH